jgi:hypothetical protein
MSEKLIGDGEARCPLGGGYHFVESSLFRSS